MAAPAGAKVIHVTTSFDVGGTQTQLRHLLTAPATQLQHAATEIFPELNFLHRQDVAIDAARYVAGGPLQRFAGRLVLDRSRRGSHLVQIAKLVRDFQIERPYAAVAWGHEISVVTFVAAAIAHVPLVAFCIRTTNPGFGWTDERFGHLLQQAHRRMSPRVDRIVVNSRLLQQDHAAWIGIDVGAIAVCPNGIDIHVPPPAERASARCDVRRRYAIGDDDVVVVTVGRFSPEKGQLSMIDAIAALSDRSAPRVVWLMCGDGPTMGAAESAVKARGLGNVIFAGRISNVQETLAASDIFVMPSDFEGMPNAMMEAMAMGLPCVSTNRSGIRDVAVDGSEALYYEPRDAAMLATHVQSLVADREHARAIGAAAARRIREYGVDRFVRCFESALMEPTPADARRHEKSSCAEFSDR
jgi:glycosyltransferase involved in cell wall biosynthesis